VPGLSKMNGFDLFVFIYRHYIENSSKIALKIAGIIYSGYFAKASRVTILKILGFNFNYVDNH
jgi:hypothetical protein